MVAYRLIANISLLKPRSHCPKCDTLIAWYDNIPLFSWCVLKGRCRSCHQSISPLYPFIELLTTLLLTALYLYIPCQYLFGYFIFFSALIVTIRSDIETMLISSYVTLFMVPVGSILSMLNMLPISLAESICGALCGYGSLFIINRIYKRLRGHDGIGEGDFELLCLIGAFTGPIGCWTSVTLGSLLGSLYGIASILYNYYYDNAITSINSTKIPFGPFISFGAIIFVFLYNLSNHFLYL